MKKMMVLSVLGLVLAAVSEQQASAYCKFNFGVGFNLGFTHAPSHYKMKIPLPAPAGFFCGPEAMPFCGFGMGGGQMMAPYGCPTPAWQAPAPLPQGAPQQQQPPSGVQRSDFLYYMNSGYQPVNYFVPMFNQYPSYWYGN